MTILHYILGFPPHRTGGLTKYAIDLAVAEKKLGHNVAFLYPQNMCIHSNISTMKKEGRGLNDMPIWKLSNGLPVPLFYGINTPSDFMTEREIKCFDKFLSEMKPDIFHIHTLMGLPIELLQLMKKGGVRVVYTTHDYFGLCPRVNFINQNGIVCEQASAKKCATCCANSWPTWMLRIRNSQKIVPLKRFAF